MIIFIIKLLSSNITTLVRWTAKVVSLFLEAPVSKTIYRNYSHVA